MAIAKKTSWKPSTAMTVMELNDLVKAFEEKFGVSAAAWLSLARLARCCCCEEKTEFTSS
jgi:large subunit ribosomal protein L7/L12